MLPDILVIDVADALAVNPVPAKAAEAKKMLDNTAVILLKRVAVFRFTVLPLSSLIGNCLKYRGSARKVAHFGSWPSMER